MSRVNVRVPHLAAAIALPGYRDDYSNVLSHGTQREALSCLDAQGMLAQNLESFETVVIASIQGLFKLNFDFAHSLSEELWTVLPRISLPIQYVAQRRANTRRWPTCWYRAELRGRCSA